MKKPQIPANESERLIALERYQILDTLPEQVYDDLTQLAADICGTPIALISLVDQNRQWFKSKVGIDAVETPRDISFCGHVVAEESILIVPNATEDYRFADNPLVVQEPKIRFYVGVPLTTPDCYILGTLCVIDMQSKNLNAKQIQQLTALSRLVISQLELRLNEQLSRRLLSVVELSNEKLIRATKHKNEFLATMSHELRTPLNAILGMAEGLQEEVFGKISDRQTQALQIIEHSGTHLLGLINDILDIAKIESGQLDLKLTPTSIHHLCESSIAFIKPQALRKKLQIDIKMPENLPDLLVDEQRICQVLINLLTNAVKFTPEGGQITIEVTKIPASRDTNGSLSPEYLRISTIDTGIGIASENIKKLFQPFIQIDSSLNRQYQGTGLGLSIVKHIVELHDGRVGLTSELGVGSCFTIDLPYTI
jgi:signal transduction histidine kinase